jgi:subtilisin
MNVNNVLKALALSSFAILLVACGSVSDETEFHPLSTTVKLSPEWAERGDIVEVKLTGANTSSVAVTVADIPANVSVTNGNEFSFVVPAGAPAGDQAVAVTLSAQTILTDLDVLGDDVVAGEFMLVVAPGTTVAELTEHIDGIDFVVLEGPRPLGTQSGTCSGELVRIQVLGLDTGEALEELKSRVDGETVWHSDPMSGYSSSAINHLGAVGADDSRLRGLTGDGTLIAVVDTGVSAHAELGGRLQSSDGYDFVDEDSTADDSFGSSGHGTPIAVLAAGSTSGVAPQAQVLPVRVCDSNGNCFTSDVLQGICHALSTSGRRSEGMGNLILNLSLGGETPISSIKAALEFALESGALVGASGGNRREQGSPRHYPAAYDLNGVVATAALRASTIDELESDWKPASFSTRGDYLDIAAPGVDLTSGNASGGYSSGYSGTSFATGLVSGALAIWREANPGMSPADVESGMKAAARPLDYPENEVGAGMLDLSNEPN